MQALCDFLAREGSKLALVEGIPGSGKTTAARALRDALQKEGKPAALYIEGDSHPADCAWQAVMSKEEYAAKLASALGMCADEAERSALSGQFRSLTRFEGERALLAYTRLRFPRPEMRALYGEFAEFELCDGRRPLAEFESIHRERWARFAREAASRPDITIFECAFLQNHIFELLGTYRLTDAEIVAHLRSLAEAAAALRPVIVYIRPKDPRAVLAQAARERRAPEGTGRKDWIDEISGWVSSCAYGKAEGLSGFEGVVAFCRERMRIDALAIRELGLPAYPIDRE